MEFNRSGPSRYAGEDAAKSRLQTRMLADTALSWWTFVIVLQPLFDLGFPREEYSDITRTASFLKNLKGLPNPAVGCVTHRIRQGAMKRLWLA